MQKHYLACDLGAESGRLVHGSIVDNRLFLEEIHRFANTPIRTESSIHWNIESLYNGLIEGLKKAASLNLPFQSISCDSWGVDYLLLDSKGEILQPTFHYRDPRTAIGMERVMSKTDWPTIFAETGIQLMALNALIQLASEKPERLEKAKTVTGIGDGFNYLLGGRPVVEISMASTFQLYNPRTQDWSAKLCDLIDLPRDIFPEVVPSGTGLGQLSNELKAATGLGELDIVATCSHDTGAAVAAVPAEGSGWAYLSSGTWSLMGVELQEPIFTDACRDLNFTNEIGYNTTIRLLKNISGLWLLQESRRAWAATGQEFHYAELTQLASQAEPFRSLIDPTDPRFVAPEDMPATIRSFCHESDQPVPDEPGSITRCILESLALLYRKTVEELESLTQRSIIKLHIVGGGSKNFLLNQLTANALQREVITGPVEATAAGNIIIQALVSKDLTDLQAARALVRQSNTLHHYQPEGAAEWTKATVRFTELRRNDSRS
ncbi:MAG: Rhamnulokinase [Verrucomicrobia subdivision 3 bacterium]|nr:Rhamnulokinase [Limisphaerales bacterium]MCS1415036.1 Rhamnulokinase [Limisphaerales bacterium]